MPVTLYLDQSDISNLVLDRTSKLDLERARLAALTTSGVLRLRVSIAHLAESAKLRFRRTGAVYRYLSRLEGTLFARAMPGEIVAAETRGEAVDLRDMPFAPSPFMETLRMSLRVGYIGPYADALARSGNQMKDVMRLLVGKPARVRWWQPDEGCGPASSACAALRHAAECTLQRPMRRSDTLDQMHLAYASYSDIATVDAFVFDVTKHARRVHGQRTSWFPTGSLRAVLDHIAGRARHSG